MLFDRSQWSRFCGQFFGIFAEPDIVWSNWISFAALLRSRRSSGVQNSENLDLTSTTEGGWAFVWY
jgi:hypothetical protein